MALYSKLSSSPKSIIKEHRTDSNLSELYKDLFLFHWKEENHHAIIDDWSASENSNSLGERDRAVDELIGLMPTSMGSCKSRALRCVLFSETL